MLDSYSWEWVLKRQYVVDVRRYSSSLIGCILHTAWISFLRTQYIIPGCKGTCTQVAMLFGQSHSHIEGCHWRESVLSHYCLCSLHCTPQLCSINTVLAVQQMHLYIYITQRHHKWQKELLESTAASSLSVDSIHHSVVEVESLQAVQHPSPPLCSPHQADHVDLWTNNWSMSPYNVTG